MTYEVKYAFKTNCTTFWNFFVSKWESWKVFDSSEWEKEGIANKGLVFWMSVCLSFIEKNVSFDKKNSIRLSNLTFFISKKKVGDCHHNQIFHELWRCLLISIKLKSWSHVSHLIQESIVGSCDFFFLVKRHFNIFNSRKFVFK